MEEYDEDAPLVTSPEMPVDPGIVTTPKAFSDALTLDLTDDEIQRALTTTLRIKKKYEEKFRYRFGSPNFTVEQAAKMIDQLEDEIKTTMAEMDILVHVDMAPVFEGEGPVIEFLGAMPSHYSAKYGSDHEKKTWEVQKALERGEVFLGANKLE